jgi:hypothetical protein
MRYSAIQAKDRHDRQEGMRHQRRLQLYIEIWRDVAAIIKLLVPKDKSLAVSNHTKSIYYNLIELKTGSRPDKI